MWEREAVCGVCGRERDIPGQYLLRRDAAQLAIHGTSQRHQHKIPRARQHTLSASRTCAHHTHRPLRHAETDRRDSGDSERAHISRKKRFVHTTQRGQCMTYIDPHVYIPSVMM